MKSEEKTIYEQHCENLRATDEISFRLLGLVPFVSATAIVVAVLKGEALGPSGVSGFALFGAVVTFGLYRWELRNIRTCNFLLAEISKLDGIVRTEVNKEPGLVGEVVRIGKTKAEKLIYSVTVFIWLLIPRAVHEAASAVAKREGAKQGPFEVPDFFCWGFGLVTLLVVLSAFANTKPPKSRPKGSNGSKT